MPEMRVLAVILVLILTGCNVQQQVRPEAPAGAGGLVPTQEDKDVGPVADSETKDEGDRSFALNVSVLLQRELVRRIQDTRLFESVVGVSEAGEPAASPDLLRVQGRITRLGRGSRAARYFGGLYDAGQTRAAAEFFPRRWPVG
jgi:hypothetical protein